MLSRILSRSNLRLISSTFSSHLHPPLPPPSNFSKTPKFPFFPHHRHFSNNNGDESDFWKINSKNDDLDDIFGTHDPQLTSNQQPQKNWVLGETDNDGGVGGSGGSDFLSALERGGADVSDAGSAANATGFTPWSLPREEDDGRDEDVFGVIGGRGGGGGGIGGEEDEKSKEEREFIDEAQKSQLRNEQQSLMEVIQGPDRAFGDLIAASGITDAMLDSLIALKNFEDVEGLPPLTQIEDSRYAKTLKKSSRYEIEIQKQEDAAKARVRKVDEKGRAYGTGKRKCSIARVWIQPGEGKFCINDKEFDVYFPMLDHRAALLSPFSETKTVGLWDVKCTVKGGGTTGQVDAIRLGISRALQNWEPGLRPPLRDAGFLTRDPRVVERKKPGKAKARKSFQWVKR